MPEAATGSETFDEVERLSGDALRALQLTRLRASLQHAYDHVPFYRESFDRAGVHPRDCRSLGDLGLFPFTVKDDLRAQYPFGMFAVPKAEVRRIHASSGTTGRPTVVGYTERDLSHWADVVARSLYAAGGRPGTPSISRTDTGCSPAVWARTTARSGSAARSSRRPVG